VAAPYSAWDDEDFGSSNVVQIAVEPAHIIFSAPVQGSSFVDATVALPNLGGAELIISGRRVMEEYYKVEVMVLAKADWAWSHKRVAARDSTVMTLRWGTVLDDQVDCGTLTLASNGGTDTITYGTSDRAIQVDTTQPASPVHAKPVRCRLHCQRSLGMLRGSMDDVWLDAR
jgi:hypothetical protein